MFGTDAYAARIHESTFQQFKVAGYAVHVQNVWTVIAGRWHSTPVAVPNLRDAIAAGVTPAAYCAVVTDGAWSVDQARAAVGDLWPQLSFLALDIEVDGTTTAAIREAVERTQQLGQRPVIYTAHWFWHGRLGNPGGFTDVPLWNAYYDDDPDMDFGRLPYGGWTTDQVVGEQYSRTKHLFGVEVDLNWFADWFFPSAPPPTPVAPEYVTKAQYLNLEASTNHALKDFASQVSRIVLNWQRSRYPGSPFGEPG